MTDVIIHSTTIVTDQSSTGDAWVAFDGAQVSDRGQGSSWQRLSAPHVQLVDASGQILTPGFVDIHVHGGGGGSFGDGSGAIADALATHRRFGTTRSVISLVTADAATMKRQISDARAVMERDPLVLGIHLEGPFLSPSHRGAHDENLLTAPTPSAVDEILQAVGGALRSITLAPELPGAAQATRDFLASGARVAVGHTSADYVETRAAFDDGASILTHAFNGMKGLHHRMPGPVAAAIDSPGVSIELIGDGTHVLPPVARMLSRSAPGRLCLVTDAMAAAASEDGTYLLGSLPVRVVNGVARLIDGGSIAGSTLTMDRALRFGVVDLELSLVEAVGMVTGSPARALGYPESNLSVGHPADAVLLDRDLGPQRVWANGGELPT